MNPNNVILIIICIICIMFYMKVKYDRYRLRKHLRKRIEYCESLIKKLKENP